MLPTTQPTLFTSFYSTNLCWQSTGCISSQLLLWVCMSDALGRSIKNDILFWSMLQKMLHTALWNQSWACDHVCILENTFPLKQLHMWCHRQSVAGPVRPREHFNDVRCLAIILPGTECTDSQSQHGPAISSRNLVFKHRRCSSAGQHIKLWSAVTFFMRIKLAGAEVAWSNPKYLFHTKVWLFFFSLLLIKLAQTYQLRGK